MQYKYSSSFHHSIIFTNLFENTVALKDQFQSTDYAEPPPTARHKRAGFTNFWNFYPEKAV
jgi:hypothetical protein